MNMPVSSISEILEWERQGNLRIPEHKAAIAETMAAILADLGLKDHGKVEETLVTGPVYGWPKLTEAVTFAAPEQRDAAAQKLRAAFLAVNPKHFTFATEDRGPSNSSPVASHSFNFAVQDYAVPYEHELYEKMRETLAAVETRLRAPAPQAL